MRSGLLDGLHSECPRVVKTPVGQAALHNQHRLYWGGSAASRDDRLRLKYASPDCIILGLLPQRDRMRLFGRFSGGSAA